MVHLNLLVYILSLTLINFDIILNTTNNSNLYTCLKLPHSKKGNCLRKKDNIMPKYLYMTCGNIVALKERSITITGETTDIKICV